MSELLRRLPEPERRRILTSLSAAQIKLVASQWDIWARPDQLPPRRAQNGSEWTQWLILGGRGAGKTRAGAEWVRGVALGLSGFARKPARRIALIAETMADARDVMVEGVSGILAAHGRYERPSFEPSRRRLTWPNGAIAQLYSAEDPESLRGPQFECAWLDELAKWRHGQECFDMLQFGLRLGAHPRQVVTTTPRPGALIKRLLVDGRSAVTRATTAMNSQNLPPEFLASVAARYAGTRLGRQELDGEIVDERADALWTRDMIERARVSAPPPMRRVVVAIDPPASSHKRSDRCGIVAAGIDADNVVYVLADESLSAARPAAWARGAIALYHRLSADCLIAETNQGGEMVAAVIAQADPGALVRGVRATRGKYLRAAPVAQLYEQGRVRHAGAFPALEDEMCDFGSEGLTSGRSPDRLDALVWAIADLALGPRPEQPRVRRV